MMKTEFKFQFSLLNGLNRTEASLVCIFVCCCAEKLEFQVKHNNVEGQDYEM